MCYNIEGCTTYEVNEWRVGKCLSQIFWYSNVDHYFKKYFSNIKLRFFQNIIYRGGKFCSYCNVPIYYTIIVRIKYITYIVYIIYYN